MHIDPNNDINKISNQQSRNLFVVCTVY